MKKTYLVLKDPTTEDGMKIISEDDFLNSDGDQMELSGSLLYSGSYKKCDKWKKENEDEFSDNELL